jgi:ComF family protein
MNMKNVFLDYLNFVVQWLFPTTGQTAKLESLTPQQFADCATRVLDEMPQGITSLFSYKDPTVHKALWALKYGGNKKIARLFAALLYDHMHEILADAALYDNFVDPIIIPIPQSAERRQERGWNQVELICEEIIKRYPQFEYQPKLLFKIKHTNPQTKLSREERLKNLRGCFSIPEDAHPRIKNRNIILVDDVTTTGSTLKEARHALLSAGARQVLCFTIAH